MEDYAMQAWFSDVFLKHLKDNPKPIILLFDGHASHITYEIAFAAKKEDVHIVCLPPKTSNALKPLDVGVFGPAKKCWYRILSTYYAEGRNRQVTKESFSVLLGRLLEVAFKGKPEYLTAGFR